MEEEQGKRPKNERRKRKSAGRGEGHEGRDEAREDERDIFNFPAALSKIAGECRLILAALYPIGREIS